SPDIRRSKLRSYPCNVWCKSRIAGYECGSVGVDEADRPRNRFYTQAANGGIEAGINFGIGMDVERAIGFQDKVTKRPMARIGQVIVLAPNEKRQGIKHFRTGDGAHPHVINLTIGRAALRRHPEHPPLAPTVA